MSPAAEPVIEGTVVADRFEMVEPLGAGGMGWVFLARDRSLSGQPVALKFLYPHLASHVVAFSRFRNEVHVARKLLHGNIVRTYNLHLTAKYAFIAMEYVAGETLSSLLRREYPRGMPCTVAVEFALQLGYALEHAHSLGIIHRDIKPENVLCSRTGEAKVGDFGLAATLRRQSELTRAGAVLGTPHYMPPEQFLGVTTDARSDIYSFGVLLYELLCGTVPFNDSSLYALAQRHIRDPLPQHEALKSGENRAVWNILVGCTMKSKNERYASVTDLLHDLATVNGIAPRATRPSVIDTRSNDLASEEPETNRWSARTRIAVVLMTLLCAAAVAISWTRVNRSAQKVAAVPILMAEERLGTTLTGLRSLLNVRVRGRPYPLADEMRPGGSGNKGLWSRLWAGDDPNDPRNMQQLDINTDSNVTLRRYPIHIASNIEDLGQIRLLLSFHADPNLQDESGMTPLHTAVRFSDFEIAKLLLENGANPNIRSAIGETPLHRAVITAALSGRAKAGGGGNDLVHLLLDYGADPLIADKAGISAVSYAIQSGRNLELVKMLLTKLPNDRPEVREKLRTLVPQEHQAEIRELLEGGRD